ncbi:MAG TPA: hypothetical protein PKJ19_16695, partial [Flavobacteriales bacterium]|nr:hypothetical protein [Flavobacteriales bacterium]
AANINTSNIQSPTIMIEGTATYSVTITDANGCMVSDQVMITRAFAGVPTQASASACVNAPPTLMAPTTGTSYEWSTGQTTQSIQPSSSGPHTVTITNAQGCQHSTTFNVTLFPLPVVDLGPDLSLCGVQQVSLDAGNAGASHLWTNGVTSQQLMVTESGSYTVQVTSAQGCVANDAIAVALNALPTDALNDMTSCVSDPVTLNAGNPGATYAWNTGATTQSIQPTASGTYSVTVTTTQNCSATFDAVVDLLPVISLDLGPDTTICAGSMILLDAENIGASHVWSTGASTSSITVGTAGTYTVTVSNGACSAIDSRNVTVEAVPTDALTDITRCEGESITLDAGNEGSAFVWSTG